MDLISGPYLKALREAMSMSQTELSRLTGISQAHIAKIENEKVNPRLSTVNTILAILMKKETPKTCKNIMSKRIITATPSDPLVRIIDLMKRFGISQLPVFQKGKPVGSIREATLIKHMERNPKRLKVRDVIDEPFPTVNATDSVDILPSLLEFHPAVLVTEKGKTVGIITKSNLLGMK